MGKVYKGYELMKAIINGDLKINQRVQSKNGNVYIVTNEEGLLADDEDNTIIDCFSSLGELLITEFEVLENEEIDIQEIKELWGNVVGDSNQCRDDFMIKNRNKINEIIKVVNKMQLNNKRNKKYCQNCGAELNAENRALKNMCNECKYGLDR